jgi:sporulation protein YlmC with PRC-barrel domain
MDLVRDVLDKQLVDREGEKMGRVDGVVLEIRADGPPRVDALELGFVVLAGRIHPRVEGWFEKIRSRWSVRKTARYRIPWSQVQEIDPHQIQIDVRVLDTPAYDWEIWLRHHVIRHLPGGDS